MLFVRVPVPGRLLPVLACSEDEIEEVEPVGT